MNQTETKTYVFILRKEFTMSKERVQVDKLVQTGRKKFVRYAEGAALYSLGLHTFQEVAKEAHAVYRVKRCVLVNTDKVDAYMENFCDLEC
jgi:Fe-S cluster biosynthesis and repair protein YggX